MQAEPDRADYQRDLAASLERLGEPLRALSILLALKDSGRLAPVDEPLISQLRQLIGGGGPANQ